MLMIAPTAPGMTTLFLEQCMASRPEEARIRACIRIFCSMVAPADCAMHTDFSSKGDCLLAFSSMIMRVGMEHDRFEDRMGSQPNSSQSQSQHCALHTVRRLFRYTYHRNRVMQALALHDHH